MHTYTYILEIDRDPDKSEWSPILGVPPGYVLDIENITMSVILIYSGHYQVTSPNLHLTLVEMHLFLLHV